MAETITVDPNPPAEIVGESDGVQLTADEQDSLAVGEQITEQQDQLLAGKYKDAEALEKAYIELQQKMGSGEKEEPEPEATETVEAEQSDEPDSDEPKEFSPQAELISEASAEFYEKGELTPETLSKFESMSSKELVEAYMQVQDSLPQTLDANDITDAQVADIKNYVGGEESYQNMVNWASENLDPGSIEAFDTIVNSGSTEAIKFAVSGLKAQYENSNGYEGRMVTGKAPVDTKDVYRSQAELVAAMNDRRYDNDPAYRQDVIDKLERSDNLQF